MLRRGVSQQRNTSVCAFCQHRLTPQRARIPQRRLLSSTKYLCDNGSASAGQKAPGPMPGAAASSHSPGAATKPNWGRPLFGSAIGGRLETPTTNVAPDNKIPQSNLLAESNLLPHEIEARKRSAALRNAESRAAAQRAEALAPKPGEPKFVFNTKRQRQIMEDIRVMKHKKYMQESLAGIPPVIPPAKHTSLTSLRRSPRLTQPAIRHPKHGARQLPLEEVDLDEIAERARARPAIPLRGIGSRDALRPDIGKPVYSFNTQKVKDKSSELGGNEKPSEQSAGPYETSSEESKDLNLAGLVKSSDFISKKSRQGESESWALHTQLDSDEGFTHGADGQPQSNAQGEKETHNFSAISRGSDADNFVSLKASKPGFEGPIGSRRPQVTSQRIPEGASLPPARGAWGSDSFSETKVPEDSQTPANRSDSLPTPLTRAQPIKHNGRVFDNTIYRKGDSNPGVNDTSRFNQLLNTTADEAQPSKTRKDIWGSLSRKQQPEMAKDDFWGAFEDTVGSSKISPPKRAASLGNLGKDVRKSPRSSEKGERNTPKQEKPAEDWGKEFDELPKRKLTVGSTSFDENIRKQSQPAATDDWTAKTTYGVRGEIYEENTRDRRHTPDRVQRFEMGTTKDRKGGKKRAQRNSRYDDEEEDHRLDDSYEDYVSRRQRKEARKAQREAERLGPRPIVLPELINISNLASALGVEKNLFLNQLGELGFEGVSLDSIMAGETAALVAQEYGFEPTVDSGESQDLKPRPPPEDPSILPARPPVVTIMGHVDHGKTTLLDYLRKSSVAAQEHGGITQHIGAFSVKMSTGKQITFLDTPGHAAFLTMRQRGANVTDIVVLVVAADDSVKPQTIEALKHARAAKVPIIVAINKIDKEGARIDRVKADLAAKDVEIEDYGGDVQVVCVSGKTGQGMTDLEESILTLSEILDMRAEEDGLAEGWILESSLKPIGKAATVLVKRGTLRPGDYIAAGTTFAKIRHLRNEAGVEIDEAPPGTPVEILGWRDLPAAGDQILQAPDERSARSAINYREGLREREKDAADHELISEQRRLLQEQRQAEKAAESKGYKRADGNWGTVEKEADTEGGAKVVNFVVKGDVHGSVEAVCACILEIGSHEVSPRVLRSAPGQITESDVEHAATSKATIVSFNLPISGQIKRQAEEAGVKILDHTVIYHLTDDVKDTLSSYLEDDVSFKVLGEAEVLQVFPINVKARKYKNIAGCRVRNGRIERNDLFRVFRAGEMLFEGKLESLKHGKKDANEARKDGECGIGFELFQDLKVGDKIQAIEEVRTQRTL